MDKNKAGRRVHKCDSVQMNLELSGGSWQTSTGSAFHRQTALGKTVWLYVLVLHWIYLYLVSNPLVRTAAGWKWVKAGKATRSFRMRYSIWTLLRVRHCWRESHWSFCSMAVTLDVRLKSRQVNRTCCTSLYCFNFGNVELDRIVPHWWGIFKLRSH